MSGDATTVEFTTFFMLPFRFAPRRQDAVPSTKALVRARDQMSQALARSGGAFTWRRADPAELQHDNARFDDRQYLHPFAWRVVQDQHMFRLQSAPWTARVAGAAEDNVIQGAGTGGEVRLHQCYLHLFDQGVGVLAIETEGHLPLPDLQSFHLAFRGVARAYSGAHSPAAYRIGSFTWTTFPPTKVLTPSDWQDDWTNGLVGALLSPLRSGSRAKGWRLTGASDNRMLLLSWVGTGIRQLSADAWARLLFVDDAAPERGSFNGGFKADQALLRQHEYRRWWLDHRIGFTRYSCLFVGRTTGSDAAGFFSSVVRDQVRGVYYTIALLMLVHRTRLEALTDQSADLMRHMSRRLPRVTSADIRRLREAVLLFATRYWFSVVSHQDQGIDMGRQWSEIMGSPGMMAEIRDEVDRFEAFESQRAAQRTERALNLLTIVLGGAALWAGLLGANLPQSDTVDLAVYGRNAGLALIAVLFVVWLVKLGVDAWLSRDSR